MHNKQEYFDYLSVIIPKDVLAVHGLAASVNYAGEVDGAAGLDEKLLGAQDRSARLCKGSRFHPSCSVNAIMNQDCSLSTESFLPITVSLMK